MGTSDGARLEAMIACQRHRGPDADGRYADPSGAASLGHNRLSIIDLSPAGRQPMSNRDGSLWIAFNGEIYNYRELRSELDPYPFRSQTDTEVVLAAFERWGPACLDRLVGMFALLIWSEREQRLFAARDRFGVKPLYYHSQPNGTLLLASEIKTLHAAGVEKRPDVATWSTFLAHGLYDHTERTFWHGISSVPPGHSLTWQDGRYTLSRWYDLAERSGLDHDGRTEKEVREEYVALLGESVRLRFRADVPVGINLSGGLDSSVLLGLVESLQGKETEAKAFTFVTGDPNYDELPWVRQMVAHTRHPLVVCKLDVEDVPDLAASVQTAQDEPFGGLPTLAYARLFERARAEGVLVLLDGQGMDEQWAGYDYYAAAAGAARAIVQGAHGRAVRPDCLTADFGDLAEPLDAAEPFPDRLRNLQHRDARYTKIPRALRFNDRVSMRSSTELREPFLDHRLFELALRQPAGSKIVNGTRKYLLRQIARDLAPEGVVEAPKRPLQTPQREWLRGPLRGWATECIEEALAGWGADWLDASAVRHEWANYAQGESDNSFYVWQWISLGLMSGKSVQCHFQPS
jgi:asparagine synthase (glutamine-hydrolysing)